MPNPEALHEKTLLMHNGPNLIIIVITEWPCETERFLYRARPTLEKQVY